MVVATGDLYVQIHVREHPIFKREDENLFCEIPISFAMAALGGELEVPTLDGRVKLQIPAETQTGKFSVYAAKVCHYRAVLRVGIYYVA